MHELSIAKNIVSIVREHLTAEEEYHLLRVKLHIGNLSAIVPDLLQSAFKAAIEDTPFPYAELNISIIPLQVSCNGCGEKSEIEPIDFRCPHCKASNVEIIYGNELTIVDLEISENLSRRPHEHKNHPTQSPAKK